MRPLRFIFPVLLLAIAGVLLRAEQAQLDPSSNPRFVQSRTRIDALFHYRNAAQPLPDARQSPFRQAGDSAGPTAAGSPAVVLPPTVAPDSDEGMLALGAGTLKVGGTVARDGITQIGINGGLYKEGDVVPVRVRGTLVYFRIRHITPDSVTIAYNEAEVTITARK